MKMEDVRIVKRRWKMNKYLEFFLWMLVISWIIGAVAA